MRSAGASLWQLTKSPFLPQMGDSFFREERSKEQFNRLLSRTPQHGVRDLGCAFIASTSGPIRTAGGDLPPTRLCRRMERKCYRHLKFRAVIPALIPRLCRGEFCGQRASENLADFPRPGARRCLSGRPHFNGRRRDHASAICPKK